MDINTKKLKKNAFRITKERGITASRVRVPGGHLDAELLGKIQEISEKYGKTVPDGCGSLHGDHQSPVHFESAKRNRTFYERSSWRI